MDDTLNTIINGDCIAGMNARPKGSVDLAFADPPFNIGYDYDVYDDKLDRDKYLAWSRDWITAVHRVLKSDGAFWLAIGDEYAAELKLASQDIGFHCRSWVIWYYTFGVNCKNKFSRSHAHLFHFVKDQDLFTFRADDLENRIPSARQLVYNDARANPKGRLPDDTWIIRPADVVGELMDDEGHWSPQELAPPSDNEQTWTLRPQDLDACFKASEDTWYFPRVAGTFKERAGFHGCQMPEQLLGRIIRYCSNEGELVLDPFSGSATTLAVAKKLGRKFLGFDISEEYITHGTARLESIRVGDRLDGSAEPTTSAPKTGEKLNAKPKKRQSKQQRSLFEAQAAEDRYAEVQLRLTLNGVREAFRLMRRGFSADRVVVDPELNAPFVEVCEKIGLVGDARTWNILLFRLRKAGELANLETTQQTSVSWEECDDYLFASEIALQTMLDADKATSIDEILCSPTLAAEFDKQAASFAPGHSSLEYRWAALKLRKQASVARTRGAVLTAPSNLGQSIPLEDLESHALPDGPGVYVLSGSESERLYVGEAFSLRDRLSKQFNSPQQVAWSGLADKLHIQTFPTQASSGDKLAWQSCFVTKYKPRLNFHELRAGTC
jgi:site-specific DNA-methyltransferase (adenine-specific)